SSDSFCRCRSGMVAVRPLDAAMPLLPKSQLPQRQTSARSALMSPSKQSAIPTTRLNAMRRSRHAAAGGFLWSSSEQPDSCSEFSTGLDAKQPEVAASSTDQPDIAETSTMTAKHETPCAEPDFGVPHQRAYTRGRVGLGT